MSVLQDNGRNDNAATDDEADVKRKDACSAIERGPAHQQRTSHRAQEEVHGDAVEQDLVAEDGAHCAAARREAVYEIKRNVEGDCDDKQPRQKHEPDGSMGLSEHNKKPPDASSGNDGVPEQNEYSGYVAFDGFHGLKTLSIKKL